MQIIVVVWTGVQMSRDTHRNWVIVYIIQMDRQRIMRTEIKRKACRRKHYMYTYTYIYPSGTHCKMAKI